MRFNSVLNSLPAIVKQKKGLNVQGGAGILVEITHRSGVLGLLGMHKGNPG